jgi:transcriptional regulator with XRE-family HTH domain
MDDTEFLKASLGTLAKLTGVSKSRWSLYFNNKKGMSEQTLINISEKLNISSNELLRLVNQRRVRASEKVA